MIVRDVRFKRFVGAPRAYVWLLRFGCVRGWAECYPWRTRDEYLYLLHYFFRSVGVENPEKFLRLSPSEIKELLVGYLNRLKAEGKLVKAWNTVKAVKSFLTYHDIPIMFKRHEKVRVTRKRVAYEHVPSKEEIYAMADVAGHPRDRALILCLWQSGVRVNCICKWTIGMVSPWLYPEICWPVPLKITSQLDSKLSSYSLDYYYTFLHYEAAQALKAYLEWRKRRKHPVDFDQPLFVSNAVKPLKPPIVREIVKRVAAKAGLDPKTIWPHLFRKAFKKTLNAADIDDDTREALMGHRIPGSRENYFDRHDLENLKQKYMRADWSRTKIITLADEPKIKTLEEKIRQLETALKTQQQLLLTFKNKPETLKLILKGLQP